MTYRVLAEAVVVIHFMFVVFVVFGGLLVVRWPRTALVHVPAACWGAAIEWSGGLCPLTLLENSWRQAAGAAGYETSFVAHYLLPIIYPAGLTREIQYVLAAIVVAVNLGVYGWLVARRRRRG